MKEMIKQMVYAWLTKLVALILSVFLTGDIHSGIQPSGETSWSAVQTAEAVVSETYDDLRARVLGTAEPLWTASD